MGGHHPLYSSRTYVELMSTNPHCVLYLSRREGLGAMKKLLTCATEHGEREQKDRQTEREIQRETKTDGHGCCVEAGQSALNWVTEFSRAAPRKYSPKHDIEIEVRVENA